MHSAVPNGLPGIPTGPQLCARLAPIELGAVPDERLIELLGAQSRQLAYQQSQLWAVMAEIAQRDPMPDLPVGARWTAEQIFESAVDEIRAELRLTRRSARRELEHADAVASLPRVAQALADGLIDRTRAIVLADGCVDLTEAQAGVLLEMLLGEAGRLTATGLAEQVRRVAVGLDPAWAERRYRQAVRERRVIGYLNRDGSATVSAQYLPAEHAAAACARVDSLADAAKRAGAGAKIDHLRAELFLGLLDGRFHDMAESAIVAELLRQFPGSTAGKERQAAEIRLPVQMPSAARTPPGVELRVGLGTLLGIDEQPGEIAGWGPVPASVARDVAAHQRKGQWRFAIVDEAGQLLSDGLTRRRPEAPRAPAQAAGGIVELHVRLRLLTDEQMLVRHPGWSGVLADLAAQHARQRPIAQNPAARFPGRPLRRRTQIHFQHCVFPGCRRPASDCDLDHRRDHSRGGRSDEENLEPGCRHDHGLKTGRGWRLIRRDEHTFVWVSPLGRRHVVPIEPVAPPLPAPIPRKASAEPPPVIDDPRNVEPSFEPRTRRGGLLTAVVTVAGTEQSGSDPPPF